MIHSFVSCPIQQSNELPSTGCATEADKAAHLEVGTVVAGDEGTVALRQHHDLLLDVLDLIFRLLQVDDLDGHDLLRPVVDPLEHLAERALADALLLREDQLRVHLLRRRKQSRDD